MERLQVMEMLGTSNKALSEYPGSQTVQATHVTSSLGALWRARHHVESV